MPRRKAAVKRKILPDPLYQNERIIAKLINVVMRRGKKSVAEKIVYLSLAEVLRRTKKDKNATNPKKADSTDEGNESGTQTGASRQQKLVANKEGLEAIEKALHNVRPTVEVKSRRVGGATYQVPIEVDSERGLALAMRMLVKAASGRNEKSMVLRLAAEILDALEGRGAAIKMRDDMHRMARANQAFAHYRW